LTRHTPLGSVREFRRRGTETLVRIKDAKDFYAGLLFMLVGAAFMAGATQYSMGTAARMGAG
jgi:hypothetical protein